MPNGTFIEINLSEVPSWALDIVPPPPPTPWTPDLMSTFRGGWRPNDLTSLSSGNAIDELSSFGGITNTLTQTGDLRPTIGIISGKKTMLYDGIDDYMLSSDISVSNGATAVSLWALVQFESIPDDNQLKFLMYEETIQVANGRRFVLHLNNNTGPRRIGIAYKIPDTGVTTIRQGASLSTMDTGVPHFLFAQMNLGAAGSPKTEIWMDGTNILMEVPGVSGVPAFAQSTFEAQDSRRAPIGGGASTSPNEKCNAHFALAGKNRGLVSDSERQKLEGYAMHFLGIQSQLPSDHPYRNAAPTV